jgi:transglutaminase-like putative cysteine protease
MRRSTSARWWDLSAAFLLLAALLTAASRLVTTEWVDHLTMIRILTFLGVLAGLALGQSRFSPFQATAFALAYGLFAVPWRLGLTLGHDILWTERLIGLAGRMISALSQLARQEPVQDPLLFLCWMSSLFWALSVYAGYTLTRHAHPWRATLPAGLALLQIHNSDPYIASRAWYLAGYLFFSLLLLARLTHLRQLVHWRQIRAHVPHLIVLDLIHVILLAVVLVVLLAWTIPALADALPVAREAWQDATRPWRTAMRERMDNAFASLRRTGALVAVADYYGENMPLGRGSELTDALVLTVQGPLDRGVGIRYYWRARVYDDYADGVWSSATLSATQSVNPARFGLTFPELEGRRTLTFTFTSAVPIATLYTAPQPRWVSRSARADLARNPDGTADLVALHATPPLRGGETYQARSSLSSVTVAQLRAAGTDYPLWVTSRYLQLPPTVTPRTRQLARQIAAGLDNPYDVAVAVTDYLRTNIRYSETVPPLATDQELLDWFLFDLGQGFCNYYASAEVILLRSLGIPARVAVGFAQGEQQAGSNTYLVRQQDAHTWPEVYFPGLGWVEFEPTVSQSPIYRLSGEGESTRSAGPDDADRGERERLEELLALEDEALSETGAAGALDSRMTAASWALFLALGLVVIALVWRRRRRRGWPPFPVLLESGLRRFDLRPPAVLRRWALRAVLPPLARAYMELNQALARLGAPPDPADTPAERAVALTRLLPVAADPAQRLLAEYHATAYGPRPGNYGIAQQAGRDIRILSWRAKIRQLFVRR